MVLLVFQRRSQKVVEVGAGSADAACHRGTLSEFFLRSSMGSSEEFTGRLG